VKKSVCKRKPKEGEQARTRKRRHPEFENLNLVFKPMKKSQNWREEIVTEANKKGKKTIRRGAESGTH